MEKIQFDKNINNCRDCLLECYEIISKKNNNNHTLTIRELINEIASPSDFFNAMLEKYDISSNNDLASFIVSKYIEINNYRELMQVIDKECAVHRVSFVKNFGVQSNFKIIRVSSDFLKQMLIDTIYYYTCTSDLYKQDTINALIQSGLHKQIYTLYPNCLFEHMEILSKEKSNKAFLIESLEEAATIIYDSTLFHLDIEPSNATNYKDMREKMFSAKDSIIIGSESPSSAITTLFNIRTGILNENKSGKILMCEMAYNGLITKYMASPTLLPSKERRLLKKLQKCNKTEIDLYNFYDQNSESIVGFFIHNINYLDRLKSEGLYSDLPEFNKAKSSIKILRKEKNDN